MVVEKIVFPGDRRNRNAHGRASSVAVGQQVVVALVDGRQGASVVRRLATRAHDLVGVRISRGVAEGL